MYGKYPTRFELQALLKNNGYKIPVHVAQHVIFKYDTARRSCIAARQVTNDKVNMPHKIKQYFNATFDCQSFKVDYATNTIRLASYMENGQRTRNVLLHLKAIPPQVKQVEIIYKNGLCANLICVGEVDIPHYTTENVASIDLGEIHTITSISQNGKSLCISGRGIRSIKYFRNKKQSKLRTKMSACKNGSCKWKRYNHAFQYIRFKAKEQINNALHKITTAYVNFAVTNNVSTVVVGDPEGVQRNTKGKMSKYVNQKISQWEFGKTIELLEYKLAAKGIPLLRVSEAWTSQTCPDCGCRNKPSGRNYTCVHCGYKQHRDIVGAMNILQFHTRQRVEPTLVKYLRIS